MLLHVITHCPAHWGGGSVEGSKRERFLLSYKTGPNRAEELLRERTKYLQKPPSAKQLGLCSVPVKSVELCPSGFVPKAAPFINRMKRHTLETA